MIFKRLELLPGTLDANVIAISLGLGDVCAKFGEARTDGGLGLPVQNVIWAGLTRCVCLPRRAGTFGVPDRAGIAGHDTRAARGVVSG